MPAVVRWRLTGPRGGTVAPWRTTVDLRGALPGCSFGDLYAVWTRQNHPPRNGRYRVLLAHRFELSALRPGNYRLEVAVADTGGNRSTGAAAFTVAARP